MRKPNTYRRVRALNRRYLRKARGIPYPLQALIFASLGITVEVVFTAIQTLSFGANSTLEGHSYMWMLPIYAMIPLLLWAFEDKIIRFKIFVRLPLYVLLIYAVEYSYGTFLRALIGVCPWEKMYLVSSWNVDGLIRLDLFPLWALAGYCFEKIYFVFNYRPQAKEPDKRLAA